MKSSKVIFATLLILLFSLGLVSNETYGKEVDTMTITPEEVIVTPTPPPPLPANTVAALIVVHRVSNTCMVYNDANQLIGAFVVSTGRKGHRTPLGTYQIYEHTTGADYHLMVDGTYGRYCMRFKEGGYMFHSVCYAKNGDATPILQEVMDLGTSVSRGCVRLNVVDAEWLYNATPDGCIVSILDD